MTSYYDETSAIMCLLAAAGQKPEAAKLGDIIEAGATASEILMGIRWHLRAILVSEPDLDADLRSRMESLIARLDRVLS